MDECLFSPTYTALQTKNSPLPFKGLLNVMISVIFSLRFTYMIHVHVLKLREKSDEKIAVLRLTREHDVGAWFDGAVTSRARVRLRVVTEGFSSGFPADFTESINRSFVSCFS